MSFSSWLPVPARVPADRVADLRLACRGCGRLPDQRPVAGPDRAHHEAGRAGRSRRRTPWRLAARCPGRSSPSRRRTPVRRRPPGPARSRAPAPPPSSPGCPSPSQHGPPRSRPHPDSPALVKAARRQHADRHHHGHAAPAANPLRQGKAVGGSCYVIRHEHRTSFVKHLRDSLRVVVAFEGQQRAWILLVGRHDNQDPVLNVYAELYRLLGVEPPDSAGRDKPPCCDESTDLPPVLGAAVTEFVHRAARVRRTRRQPASLRAPCPG